MSKVTDGDIYTFLTENPGVIPVIKTMVENKRRVAELEHLCMQQEERITNLHNDNAQLSRDFDDATRELHRLQANLGSAMMILKDEARAQTAFQPGDPPLTRANKILDEFERAGFQQ